MRHRKPQDGINALDALVIAYMGIATLRQHIRSDARIHGIITNGGAVPNVVPDYAAGRFFVRAPDDEYLDELVQRLAMTDIRRRYPQASPRECDLRLASRWLGAELMRRAFGWDPDKEGY